MPYIVIVNALNALYIYYIGFTLLQLQTIMCWSRIHREHLIYHHHDGPLTRYVQLWVAHDPGMPGTFSPPPRVSDPDMHYGTCVTHVPWCMPGSLTGGFLQSRWWGKCSRNSGKRPIADLLAPNGARTPAIIVISSAGKIQSTNVHISSMHFSYYQFQLTHFWSMRHIW